MYNALLANIFFHEFKDRIGSAGSRTPVGAGARMRSLSRRIFPFMKTRPVPFHSSQLIRKIIKPSTLEGAPSSRTQSFEEAPRAPMPTSSAHLIECVPGVACVDLGRRGIPQCIIKAAPRLKHPPPPLWLLRLSG